MGDVALGYPQMVVILLLPLLLSYHGDRDEIYMHFMVISVAFGSNSPQAVSIEK